MLPSTSNTRRMARSRPVDDSHSFSRPATRPSTPIPTGCGHRSLATQLRWFLCGCGLLYIVLLWHWGLWTADESSGRSVATSMRETEVVKLVRADDFQSPSTIEEAADDVATATTVPTWTSTPSPSNTVDVAWLRSLVLTTPAESPSTTVVSTAMPISPEDYTARMEELERSRRTLQLTIGMLKTQLAKVRMEIKRHAKVIADEEAKLVRPLPRDHNVVTSSTPREFVCVGWRATANCDPRGPRVPSNDRLCYQRVPPQSAGYCEIQDERTQERFRVMETRCDTFRYDAQFSCSDARPFLNFSNTANNFLRQYQQNQHSQQNPASRGIVLVVYPKMLPSAYATLRMLRRLACTLSVELWYSPPELRDAAKHPIIHAMIERFGPVTVREIQDSRAHGYTNKIHAIRYSAFDHVLFLDADNVPVKDPTYLFELPEYKTTGALFWPDFWHPNHTIFAIHPNSLVWEYLDLPFVDMFEQESGQLVVDKTRSDMAFALLEFYAYHQPNLLDKLKLVHGDKDLFRFAWLKSNTSFFMVEHPPGIAGNVIDGMFCGQTMAQFDPSGELLFLHRNAKKLQGKRPKKAETIVPHESVGEPIEGEFEVDPEIWTHLQRLKPTSTRIDYIVEIYKGSSKFPQGQWCYGKPSLTTDHFDSVRFADLPEGSIENEIRAYAIEATDLQRDAQTKKPRELRHA